MEKKNAPERESIKLKLLKKLELQPEARTEPSKGPFPGGRIKKFFAILKGNLSVLTMTNMFAMIFAIPLLVAVLTINIIGIENFTYLLTGVKDAPYLLGNFGIGISQAASLQSVKIDMLLTYRVIVSAVAVLMPFLAFGFAGSFHIMTKLEWGESFICKKDKYGNDVPRIAIEFFRGVKLYWKQFLLILIVFALIFAGAGNLIITFIDGLWRGTATAGHYVGLIVACIIMFITTLVTINLLPLVVSYDMPLRKKLKNAFILTAAFFVPSVFILIFAAAPFMLVLAGSIFTILIAIATISLGISYVTLMFANYGDYNSEVLLVPLYEASLVQRVKQKSKKKKNKK